MKCCDLRWLNFLRLNDDLRGDLTINTNQDLFVVGADNKVRAEFFDMITGHFRPHVLRGYCHAYKGFQINSLFGDRVESGVFNVNMARKSMTESWQVMSALERITDSSQTSDQFRKVPRTDIGLCLNLVRLNHILVPFNANSRRVWNMQVPVFDCVRLLQD